MLLHTDTPPYAIRYPAQGVTTEIPLPEDAPLSRIHSFICSSADLQDSPAVEKTNLSEKPQIF